MCRFGGKIVAPVINYTEMPVCGYTFEDYVEIVKRFHGAEAPGVLIGGFMVAAAIRNLPHGILYDAISETRTCLPDAIQLLTPCTIGNGWLKVIHLGRYALILYNKENNEGVRIFLDAEKVRAWQEIEAWYFKLKQKQEQDRRKIIGQIREAGESILGIQKVRVQPQFTGKLHKGKIAVCSGCGEAYPADDGKECLACQGNILCTEEPGGRGFGMPWGADLCSVVSGAG
jgi:formylmethanofuran dehydrogenase subunit E